MQLEHLAQNRASDTLLGLIRLPSVPSSARDKHYPNRKLDAASLVYTKAPQIIRAFGGAVIRSRRGRRLATPP
jgi:hypothetical protein